MATQQNTARILIACDDAMGLVYQFSKIFYDLGLNIISNQEYVDNDLEQFFMRTVVTGEFSCTNLHGLLTKIAPLDSKIQVKTPRKKNIIILVTKESHALGDILIRHSAGQLDAKIQAVIGNHETLEKLVNRFDIPFHFISAKDITRVKHENLVKDCINAYEHDYIILAKYMRILSTDFVKNYVDKIINIHHSFLPAFVGANPYKQAFERGVKIIGATAHFVTNELDEGPIIAQNITPVNHRFNWQDMQAAGRDVEKSVLSRALNLVLNDRVLIDGNKTIVF